MDIMSKDSSNGEKKNKMRERAVEIGLTTIGKFLRGIVCATNNCVPAVKGLYTGKLARRSYCKHLCELAC